LAEVEANARPAEKGGPLSKEEQELLILVEDARKKAVEADNYLLAESKKLRTRADEAVPAGEAHKLRSELLRKIYEAINERSFAIQNGLIMRCVGCGREEARGGSCPSCGGELRVLEITPQLKAKAVRDYERTMSSYQTEREKYYAQESIRTSAEKDIKAIESLRQQLRKGYHNLRSAWDAWAIQGGFESGIQDALRGLKGYVNKAKSFTPAGTERPPLPPSSKVGDPAKPQTVPEGPRPVQKVYVMKDGTRIEVVSEMAAGDEVVLKKADGESVTVKRAEVERVEKP
jgi:hypothetical protein